MRRPLLAGLCCLAGLVGAAAVGGSAPPPVPVASAGGGSGGPASGFGSVWPQYHGNSLGSGVDSAGTSLSPLHHAWTSPVLQGQLYGEPLVDAGRVVAATEDDTVYVLAANTGHVIWSDHLGTPVPAGNLPCGDISPTVGITDTPVIDTSRDEIFVEADEAKSGGGAQHRLYGIDLFTGKVLLSQAVDPPGSDTLAQLQRTGLTLADGQVVMGYGGNDGDCSSYHGWVVAVPETGGPIHTFEVDAAPGDSQGAIWMGGAAPLVDKAGNIWVSVGNGSVTSSSRPYDDSDSVLELSPSLKLEQYFAPTSWPSDNANDADLGSAAPALVDGMVFQVGKAHVAYLMRQSRLGGIGGELASMPLCGSNPDGGLAVSGSTVYVPCGNGVEAVAVTASPPSMHVLWPAPAASGGPPIVAGGRIWTISGGTLYGLNPANGGTVVTESIGGEANHFPTPSVGDGLLLAPSTDQVVAFDGPAGLPPPPPPPPTAARYWEAEANGSVFAFGGAPSYGSQPHVNRPVVAMATDPFGRGYWLAASDGGVFTFGNAKFYGSEGGRFLNKPVVGMASTVDGGGYWLVASDGGIFSFGDARFYGSEGGRHLNRPIVGMAAAPDGHGYWLVASDGGIFSFGSARFHGSLGGIHLVAPVVAMAATRDGGGYWLAASDGGVFALGDARFLGSQAAAPSAGAGHRPGGDVRQRRLLARRPGWAGFRVRRRTPGGSTARRSGGGADRGGPHGPLTPAGYL